MRRLLYVAPLTTGLILAAPFYVAAATNADVIAVLKEGIAGLVSLLRDAYCAAGVQAFCP